MRFANFEIDNIVFNNKGIDTISQIASHKTVLNIIAKNGLKIEDNLKHTPLNPYISKIYNQLEYDNKKRYKTDIFKPVIKYCKISDGLGLSNYMIIIQNIPALFDYSTLKKKSKNFYCLIIFTGLHQPTKSINTQSIKFISKMLKRKCFKLYSQSVALDYIDNEKINYAKKEKVKKALKNIVDDKDYFITGSSLYCNKTGLKTIEKVLIYDKYNKQKIYHKQLLNDNLNGWKRLEIEIKPTEYKNYLEYIKSNEFKKKSLGTFDTIAKRLNTQKIDNSYLNYQLSGIIDNRTLNNPKSKNCFNSKESLTRFKKSDFKPYSI